MSHTPLYYRSPARCTLLWAAEISALHASILYFRGASAATILGHTLISAGITLPIVYVLARIARDFYTGFDADHNDLDPTPVVKE